MKVDYFCPRWGSDDLSWEVFCRKVHEAGYDGIEYAVPSTVSPKELDEAWENAAKYHLKVIVAHYDTVDPNFENHYRQYEKWFELVKSYPAVRLNSQTGKDYFSFEQNRLLIELAISRSSLILHEIHRGKFSFSAHTTVPYLKLIPGLRLTFDVSHWVCVSESFLEDQQEAVEIALDRVDHIHARVGHPEGPQVSDPRIAEWNFSFQKHLSWWDAIVEKKKAGDGYLTIAPEFGPFPYMINNPLTGEPLSDQWEVNCYTMKFLRKRYS